MSALNGKEKSYMFSVIYNLSMIAIGALSGSALSLKFGVEGGIIGALSFAAFYGVLVLIAERKSNNKAT